MLQPLAQVVLTKALLTQLRELLPWQLEALPSQATQPWPLARQSWPLQAPVQHTCAPPCVGSQAPDRQSPSTPHACPSTRRHAPLTNTSPWFRQTHTPSVPHTRPEAAQFGVQQRCAPLRSAAHEVDAHCVPAVQAWPVGSRPLQTPVAALQPLPHWVLTTLPSSQRAEVLPWQVDAAPSQSTQPDPSAAQKGPQACAQHTLPPPTVSTHAPEAQSLA